MRGITVALMSLCLVFGMLGMPADASDERCRVGTNNVDGPRVGVYSRLDNNDHIGYIDNNDKEFVAQLECDLPVGMSAGDVRTYLHDEGIEYEDMSHIGYLYIRFKVWRGPFFLAARDISIKIHLSRAGSISKITSSGSITRYTRLVSTRERADDVQEPITPDKVDIQNFEHFVGQLKHALPAGTSIEDVEAYLLKNKIRHSNVSHLGFFEIWLKKFEHKFFILIADLRIKIRVSEQSGVSRVEWKIFYRFFNLFPVYVGQEDRISANRVNVRNHEQFIAQIEYDLPVGTPFGKVERYLLDNKIKYEHYSCRNRKCVIVRFSIYDSAFIFTPELTIIIKTAEREGLLEIIPNLTYTYL